MGERADWLAVVHVRPRGWFEAEKKQDDNSAFQNDFEPPFVVGSTLGSEFSVVGDANVEAEFQDVDIEDEIEPEPSVGTESDEFSEESDTSDSDYGSSTTNHISFMYL